MTWNNKNTKHEPKVNTRQRRTEMSETKRKTDDDKTENINLHGIPKSLFSLGSVDFWNNEPWDGKRKGWWNDEWREKKKKKKSNKMGHTWQGTDLDYTFLSLPLSNGHLKANI